MRKCIVCGNSYWRTRYARPELMYHAFPKNEYRRMEWLAVYGMDDCYSNYHVCSDHFLEESYVPGKNRKLLKKSANPQPYQNEFSFSDTNSAQNNDANDAGSSTFLYNGARNIPSTSTSVNSQFIRLHKPSCSSTNYAATVGSTEIPLIVYIYTTNRSTKDFEPNCCVPGCITNTSIIEDKDISFFAPPIECVDKWSSAIGLNLTTNSIICERHFKPLDIMYPELVVDGSYKKVKSLVSYALPIKAMQIIPRHNIIDLTNESSSSDDD